MVKRIVCCSVIFFTAACVAGDDDDSTFVKRNSLFKVESSGDTLAAPGGQAGVTPIVFRSDRAQAGVGDLYVMAADGRGVKRLTHGGEYTVPEWSPTGDHIAFRQMTLLGTEVGIMALDGSPPVLLTRDEDAFSERRSVHWLPDGQRIAYGRRDENDALMVWVVSRTGGELELPVPALRGRQETAEWSPDGSRVVQTELVGEMKGDLWVVSGEQESEPVNITLGRVFAASWPRWSPDGTRVALTGYALLADGSIEGFGNHAEGGYEPPDAEIFIVDLATLELTRITDNAVEDEGPAWSPDGQSLIVQSQRDGDADLWLIPLDDPEQARNLIDDADAPSVDEMPHWYWGSH